MRLSRFGAVIAALVLSACGGGGGGGGNTSISVSPNSLTFTQESGESVPAHQNVAVTYKGDGLLIGYPPEVEPPDWITVVDNGGVPGSHSFGIHIGPATLGGPGTLHTTLRIVTGRADGSHIKHKDVAITYTATPSTFSSASTASLGFVAPSGGSAPAPQDVEVAFSDGQIVSVNAAYGGNWLSISGSGTTSPSTRTISITRTDYPQGTSLYDLIVFTVQRPSGSTRSISIPVNLYIDEPPPPPPPPPQPLAVSPATATYATMDGVNEGTALEGSFSISGEQLDWTASSNQDWLALAQTAGTQPATVGFTVDHGVLAPGTHAARVTVHDANADVSKTVDVTLTITAPQLIVTEEQPFEIDAGSTAADLAQTVSVSDESGAPGHAIGWTLQAVDVPWLQVSPESGSTQPAAELTYTIDSSKLDELENGEHHGTAVLTYTDSGGVARSKSLAVVLDLTLPKIEAAAPHVVVADSAGKVVLNGSGFTGVPASAVKFGSVTATGVQLINDHQLRVQHPALASGNVQVTIDNALGLDAGSAELAVVAAQSRPYAAFDVTEAASRVIFDDERATLYAVEQGAQRIARYGLVAGVWTELTPVSAPLVMDAALSVDGKKLYVLATRQISELDLTDPLATLTVLHTASVPVPLYWRFAIANDGMAMISPSNYSSGLLMWQSGSATVTEHYVYDASIGQAMVNASADGTAVYLIQGDRFIYQPGPDATWQFATGAPVVTAVNIDGSRLLMNHNYVYDGGTYQENAMLRNGIALGVFGRRVDRAYSIRATDEDTYGLGDNVWVVNPTGPTEPTEIGIPVFSEASAVAIPAADMPQTEGINFYYKPATVSADDNSFFFQGLNKLIIVPVGAD